MIISSLRLMVFALLTGDLCIPQRAIGIPAKFKKLLVPGKISKILCTGNLGSKQSLDYLRSISADLVTVNGDLDDLPSTTILGGGVNCTSHRVVEVGEFKIGLVHGHQLIPWGDPQALRALASQLDVNIMISGHTGWFEAYEQDDGRLYINPGSLTGAYSGGLNSGESRPSFALMDCQSGGQLTIYVYQLIDGEVKVERLDFTLSVRT